MERSIRIVADYLDQIVSSLKKGESFVFQKKIGIRAEQRMREDLGTNTHKGFIFLSGMLLIARWHAGSSDERSIRRALSSLSEGFFGSGGEKATNGQHVRMKYNTGGIVEESINGFPAVFDEALPVFRAVVKVASFAMLARLMQTVDDTTTLHRAGPPGLARVRRDGHRLAQTIAEGGDYMAYLRELNRSYASMNITIGGIADMLGLAYGLLIASGEISVGNDLRIPSESACTAIDTPLFRADALHADIAA
jgi:triphosphoribosyl-dephospho-CoA synthase